ncbi:MAG: hypothetical protein ACRCT2_17450 [Plesiomonas shigelloides]
MSQVPTERTTYGQESLPTLSPLFKVVLPSGQRVLVSTAAALQTYLTEGATVVGTADDIGSGTRWVAVGTQIEERTLPNNLPYGSPEPQRPTLDLSASVRYSGQDLSTGETIFGLDLNRIAQFQSKLVPEGMSTANAETLIGLAADPVACPRKYGIARGTMTQQDALMDMVSDTVSHLSEAFQAGRGRANTRYRLSSENGALEEVLKGRDRLSALCSKYRSQWERDVRTQESVMRGFLQSLEYDPQFVEHWLYAGLLPTLIRLTAEYHLNFLNKMLEESREYPMFEWTKTPAFAELEDYYEDIRDWRANTTCQSQFIGMVYVKYRGGYRQGFRGPKQSKALTDLVHEGFLARTGGGTGDVVKAKEGTNCSHCGRTRSSCLGGGRCYFASIPSGLVKDKLAGMSHRTAKRVGEKLKELRAANENGDPLDLFEKAIAAGKASA